jgi:hypothetical protein
MVDVYGTTSTLARVLYAAGLGIIALCLCGFKTGPGKLDAINKVTRIRPGMVAQLAGLALLSFTAEAWVEGESGRGFRNLEGIGLCLSLASITAGIMLGAAKAGPRFVAGVAVFAGTGYGMRPFAEPVVMDLEAMNSN